MSEGEEERKRGIVRGRKKKKGIVRGKKEKGIVRGRKKGKRNCERQEKRKKEL